MYTNTIVVIQLTYNLHIQNFISITVQNPVWTSAQSYQYAHHHPG